MWEGVESEGSNAGSALLSDSHLNSKLLENKSQDGLNLLNNSANPLRSLSQQL